MPPIHPQRRLRRLRRTPALRDMLAEARVHTDQLIAPLFVTPAETGREAIEAMPGQFRHSVPSAMQTVRRWAGLGIRAVLLFGLPSAKDATGRSASDDAQPVQRLVRQLASELPEVVVITDVCLCEYTDHGHCGLLTGGDGDGRTVDNDATLPRLREVAVSHARNGAHVVAPSAMMDGQVAAIRSALDAAGYGDVAILSYAVKYASSFYGPFREAAGSGPGFGDRRDYQMDPRTARQAVLEAGCDVAEGADVLMVKPAMAYLDVLADLRRRFDLPLAAYHVSGEYACLHAAAERGWLDLRSAAVESITGIVRAGADWVITYFAEDLAGWLGEGA